MDADFLGVGVSFPLKTENGKITWSKYEDSIRESILLILGTSIGERVMRPDFGCRIHDLAFSVNDTSTASFAIFHVEEALKKWEPRIELIKVDANNDEQELNRLNISIEYRIISSNTRYNLVYPFYVGSE
ncbi:GPW/gp25 family protein [Methanolobus sediminis]|uniref:GPW/gp25 family protein n=1 Tax=Methanolobus sediminis TaxID=3072978 RepID=A0AA51UKJ8_9EURY|nr:GPW/gp25 family protein [Methanolobus sediminis]WMW25084.1 GPW/gp25 family protein [Methanolobus sediminis]